MGVDQVSMLARIYDLKVVGPLLKSLYELLNVQIRSRCITGKDEVACRTIKESLPAEVVASDNRLVLNELSSLNDLPQLQLVQNMGLVIDNLS